MPARTKKFVNRTIKPMMGGALLQNLSGESASGEHYTKKLNFRRDQEGETRREGWDLFSPSGQITEALPWAKATYDENYGGVRSTYTSRPFRLITQFRSGDNITCLLVAHGDKIYRYKYNSHPEYINKQSPSDWVGGGLYHEEGYIAEPEAGFEWKIIASGLSSLDDFEPTGQFPHDPIRWETAIVNGTIYLNNGKDLPLMYREDMDQAMPILELRENPAYRVASVGTICEFNGFLMLGDISQIHADDWEDWMKGSDPYGEIYEKDQYSTGEVRTTRSAYSIIWSYEGDGMRYGTPLYGTMAEGTNEFISRYPLQGNKIVPWASATTTTLEVLSTFVLQDTTYTSTHIFAEGEEYEIKQSELQYVVVEVGGKDYHVGRKYHWDYKDERLTGHDTQAHRTFAPGTEVVIVGAGDNTATINGESVGGVLGFSETDIGFSRLKVGSITDNPDGTQTYTIVDKNGDPVNALSSITADELETPVMNSVTGFMVRLDSIGKLTNVVDIVDDGSRILKMKNLVDRMMIYRETGYMTCIRVNTAEVFQFEKRYQGPRVIDFRNTLIDVAGRFHLFMGYTGVYQVDRAASQPKLLQPMEKGTQFWEGIDPQDAEKVFTFDNPETKEIFFCSPTQTFAFDYENQTVSEIDQVFSAGMEIMEPKTSKRIELRMTIMGVVDTWKNLPAFARNDDVSTSFLVRYGHGPDGYRIFNRYGNEYRSVLQSGLIDFTDQFNDKNVRSYALHVAENTLYGVPSTAQVKIRVSTLPTAQAAVGDITEVVLNEDGEFEFSSGERVEAEEILTETTSENMIPLFLRGPYFRDAIIIEGKDNPIKLIGRTFEVSGLDSRLTQVTTNQG